MSFRVTSWRRFFNYAVCTVFKLKFWTAFCKTHLIAVKDYVLISILSSDDLGRCEVAEVVVGDIHVRGGDRLLKQERARTESALLQLESQVQELGGARFVHGQLEGLGQANLEVVEAVVDPAARGRRPRPEGGAQRTARVLASWLVHLQQFLVVRVSR